MAIDTRGEAADRPSKPTGRPAKKRTSPALFYRQIVAELRKVIWPTRKDLISYTTIVLVFVLVMVGIVAGVDALLTKGVLAIFG
ncbi:protein translocase subunit SecE [Sphaerisporangium krabiense]|uniref:Protein translocase subunit SecE n=1 Tax=Sphaerisporangium krabiense TaxID=763782 RepID=A0A7W9DN42_9ACTN|nr:preprotein translocase subunit SecE [Sphaerisporangium krabiense]MBB5624953.1 preprotein translocase subunit SecE [Sphaerisporangium krabiense]GII67007.1 protein translocase subunit SecE [Sphaerisporangium krabiense]